MTFLEAVLAWLTNPLNWQGRNGVPARILEHLGVSGAAILAAAAVGVTLGVWFGHTGRGGFFAINVVNVGRALPSMALLAFALPVSFALGLGLGFWPTLFAMVPLGIPPILTNSYIAVREVDPEVKEAARGMGMSGWQILFAAELPVAAPLILAGVRNAAVAIVATATLGALVAGGGLGRYIVDGLALQQYDRVFVGALLVASLAVATELAFSLVERLALSPGVRAAAPARPR